ncbi:hypothetical protein HJG60_009002 [Phyllostomus discolor]|uniref:Uncharacterized protein n=1 Tax=Phyllostomus discolor TaxID=89673 RepID=A0A833YM01_9CHIR|nr:hypothetical protein HJG60_009002 [Phyllostomus discolor]
MCLQDHCPHPRACQARSPWGSQDDAVTSQPLPPTPRRRWTIGGSSSSYSGSCSRSRSLSLNVSSVSSVSSTSSHMSSVQSMDSGDIKCQFLPQSKSSSKVTSVPGQASDASTAISTSTKSGKASTLSMLEEVVDQLKVL